VKIVSKDELKKMPKGTPFAEYHGKEKMWPQSFDIFVDDCEYIDDFHYRSMDSPEHDDSEQLWERQAEMGSGGASYPVDLEIDREGLYDPDTRYLVWEPDDVRRIINLLQGGDDERDN